MSRIRNTIALLNILSLRSVVGISELAEILEVDPRTIRRMRDDLLDLGYDIESFYGPGGGLRLVGDSKVPLTQFTADELQHIRNGMHYLGSMDKGIFGFEFYQSIAKLNHYFDTTKDYNIIDTAQSVILNVDAQEYQKMIRTLEGAIALHQRVAIEYEKNKRTIRNYTFEPYELLIVNQSWYVLGYEKSGRQLSLKVSRIKRIETLDSTFRWDENFKKSHGVSSFGFKVEPVLLKVKVRNFDYISEYIWGTDQKIEWLNDTSYTLEANFSSKLLAKEFILKGGRHLEVLSPLELRDWVHEEVKAILDQYQ